MTISTRPRSDLTGMTVLIVEDEFYLAVEMQDEMERAGAIVLGPCADAEAGLQTLARNMPDCALIDINLGTGPSFEVADALQAAAVPYYFLTGYDASTIPPRFADVPRIQKPANLASLVRTLAATGV